MPHHGCFSRTSSRARNTRRIRWQDCGSPPETTDGGYLVPISSRDLRPNPCRDARQEGRQPAGFLTVQPPLIWAESAPMGGRLSTPFLEGIFPGEYRLLHSPRQHRRDHVPSASAGLRASRCSVRQLPLHAGDRRSHVGRNSESGGSVGRRFPKSLQVVGCGSMEQNDDPRTFPLLDADGEVHEVGELMFSFLRVLGSGGRI